MNELRDWPVRPLSRDQIRRDSVDLRKRLGVHALRRFSFIDLLRKKIPHLGGRFSRIQVIVRPSVELNGRPAITRFIDDKNIRIFITRDVEDAALNECPEAQRILMHEFGHARYHDQAPKAYLAGDFEALRYAENCETSAEWQADEAQLSLAAPDLWVEKFQNWRVLAVECNLIPADAKKAIEIYNLITARRLEHPAYTAFKREGIVAARQVNGGLPPEAEELWLNLEPAEDRDPFFYRLCPRGFLIARDEYLKMTPCGWRIFHGIVEAYYNISS